MIFQKQKSFIGQVKSLLKGEEADAYFIWNYFEGEKSEENATYFCMQLLEHLIHSDKKGYLLQNEQKLYSTLLTMQLYKVKKAKSQKVQEQCKNFIQKQLQTSHGKSLLQFIFEKNRNELIAKFFISRLVLAPLKVNWQQSIENQAQKEIDEAEQYCKNRKKRNWHQNYQILKLSSFPKRKIPQTKLVTFGYVLFNDYLKKKRNILSLEEYKHLGQTLKFVMQSSDSIPNLQQYLMKLVYLINKCITYYGCREEVLKDLILSVNALRNWPGTVGKVSDHLFNTMLEQIKVPGSAFRNKLSKDFPSLKMESSFLNKYFFFITDKEELFNRQQDISVLTLRKLIIINILKSLQFQEQKEVFYTKILKHLDSDETLSLYKKLTKMVELSKKLSSKKDIGTVLYQNIEKLFNQISKDKIKSGHIRNQLGNDKQSFQMEQFQLLLPKVNQFGFFDYPHYEIITVSINDFLNPKSNGKNILDIIDKHKADCENSHQLQNAINVVFHGDGSSYFKFVNAIARYTEKVDIEELVQFKIYYLPLDENSLQPGLGKYLSYIDPWYRNFLFNIFGEKIFFPHLELNKKNRNLFPFYFYRRSLELYLRQASYYTSIRLYKCTLKMVESDIEDIFFMSSYFGVGLFCQARIIKMQKEKQKGKQGQYGKQLLEIIDEKIEKGIKMNLQLQYQLVEPLTNEIKFRKQKNIKVEDLQICNLPLAYFMGRKPNPSSINLQMTILTDVNSKIFKKEIGYSEYFRQNRTKQEVEQAFKDLFICKTIRSISIQNLNKDSSLRVMIDGNLATKIEKIKIQPAVSASGIPIALKMQTFMPS